MRVSEVLSGSVEQFLTLSPQIQDHLDREDNPHKVSKSQVGLGNVTNDKQATDADFRSHLSAPVLAHPDGSVTAEKLADGAVTAQKIADGAVGDAAIGRDSITANCLEPSLRNLIKNKVDQEEGMGLSQNSFTDAEKAKLGAISVSDGEGLSLDTSSLVLKSEPLTIRKTGFQLLKTGEKRYGKTDGFTEILSVWEEPRYGRIMVAGRNYTGAYQVVCAYPDQTQMRYYGTANTVCHCFYEGVPYFGEMADDQVTITTFQNGVSSVWKTLSAGCENFTTLQHIFVLEDRILVVYTSDDSSGSLYVESFNLSGVRQWQFVTGSRLREYYTDSTIYNRRFRMAVMDGDDLYIAPVLDRTNTHAALRINKDGEITGRYMPITDSKFTKEEQVLQDISVSNGYLYGFFSNGYIAKFHTETGNMYKIYFDGAAFGTLKGLNVGRGGQVSLLADNSSGSVTRFSTIDGIKIDAPAERVPILDFTSDMDGTYQLCRVTRDGYEFFYLDDTKLQSHVYTLADTYTVL